MNLIDKIKQSAAEAMAAVYDKHVAAAEILINETKPEFEGDYTLVTFSLSKLVGKKPDEIAQELGDAMVKNNSLFTDFNVIKGFLNLRVNQAFFVDFLHTN